MGSPRVGRGPLYPTMPTPPPWSVTSILRGTNGFLGGFTFLRLPPLDFRIRPPSLLGAGRGNDQPKPAVRISPLNDFEPNTARESLARLCEPRLEPATARSATHFIRERLVLKKTTFSTKELARHKGHGQSEGFSCLPLFRSERHQLFIVVANPLVDLRLQAPGCSSPRSIWYVCRDITYAVDSRRVIAS